jgi:hypothetical protein
LKEDFTREEMELVCDIVCTQSGYKGTGKSRFNEDQIKHKVRGKVEKDLNEFWNLDENVTYWVNFFISFTVIYLTYMKLKQSKFEKYLEKHIKNSPRTERKRNMRS